MSGPRPGPRLRSSLGTGRLRYDLCPREAEMSRRTAWRGAVRWTEDGRPRQAPPRHGLVARDQIEALAPAWRSLARTSARTPFESPDWLLPWWRHYGTGAEPVVVTWWADDDLVGVAPLRRSHARASGLAGCEVALWGAPGRPAPPLRGGGDVLALEPPRSAVMAGFARWLPPLARAREA